MSGSTRARDALWNRHAAEWRDPAQITSQWEQATALESELLRFSVTGSWWDVLEASRMTLLVTREYEHLVTGVCVDGGRPHYTFMPMPHPSGLAVVPDGSRVFVASTRNPNQLYELAPVVGALERLDSPAPRVDGKPLVAVASRFYPGCLYIHDLAFVGGTLHANAVGENAVVRFDGPRHERVWWPRAIECDGRSEFRQNYIQLNSIAAGRDIESSFFSASSSTISARRPGHVNFPVDGRGVIFSGRTREPVATGLTRPHSARIHDGRVWVDNSGYGEVGFVDGGSFVPVARLDGWTRGLAFHADVAFVGTSRVIPRFRGYAPGLDTEASVCGVHAVDTRSGRVLGSLRWPAGNQVFAVECVPQAVTTGLAFAARARRSAVAIRSLFYTFTVDETERR